MNTETNNFYKISDLVDINILNELFEKFTKITGYSIALLDYPDMNILIKSGWQDICTKFHRNNEQSLKGCFLCNKDIANKFEKHGQIIIEKCENGLYDCAMPIFIEGKLLAIITSGQILIEKPDVDLFLSQAKKYSFNEDEYISALEKVKVVTKEDLFLTTSFLGQITSFISESGFNELKIKQESKKLENGINERIKAETELQNSDERYKSILSLAPEAFFHGNKDGYFIEVNNAAISLTGFSRDELLKMRINDLFSEEILAADPLRYDLLRTGVAVYKQRQLQRRDGKIIIIEMHSWGMPNGTLQCFAKDITEQVNDKEALRKSENRLKLFFECSQEGIIFHDKGIIKDANEAMLKIWGKVELENVINKNIIDYISPLYREIVTSNILSRSIDKYEAEIIRSDGAKISVEITPRYLEFNDGQKLRVASIIDITDRKKSEQIKELNSRRTIALLKLNQMINAPLEKIADFVLEEAIKITKSKIGYLAFVSENEEYMTMHTWSESAMSINLIKDFTKTFEINKTGLWGESVRQRKSIITNDYEADNPAKKGYPQGHVALKRHLSVPIFSNERIVALIGVGNKEEEYNDECIKQITILGSAMWAHFERQRVLKELIDSKEQFRLITENSNDMIITFDLEIGTITYISQSVNSSSKWTQEEIYGHSIVEFVHPDEIVLLQQLKNDVYENKKIGLIKHRILMRDGSYAWYETNCKVVKDENSDKIKIVAVCRDIGEIIEKEKLQKEKEIAEAANKAKSEFLANVSHEIRNPLNSIVGMAKTLSRLNPGSDIKNIVDAIIKSSNSLLSIISDVLDFSKIEANKIEMEEKNFDVSQIFENIESLYKTVAEDKGLLFKINKDSSVPQFVYGDALRYKQILINLVANAIKFTDSGSVLININACNTDDKQILITTEVKDTGIGIKNEDIDKLFDSFLQLDSSTTKKYAGTGLGLAIAKSFCSMMGGEINVESQFGKGSSFILKIPFKLPIDEMLCVQNKNSENNKSDCRVLVVEDDTLNQIYLKSFLTSKGFIVDSAYNGLQAVEKFEIGKYNIILMDGQMPEMDGFEATRIIREKEKDKSIRTPVIAITGYAVSGDEERFLKVGMDSYITKPFDENKLIETINKLIS